MGHMWHARSTYVAQQSSQSQVFSNKDYLRSYSCHNLTKQKCKGIIRKTLDTINILNNQTEMSL